MKERVFLPPPVQEIALLEDEPNALKRILFMDDDEVLLARVNKFLGDLLFRVTFARNGASALRDVMENDFDLLVCNMTNPNFSGRMFHVAVGRIKPQLCNRFIFMTDRSADPATNAFIRQVNGIILWKPFELHVLLETVNLVLEKRCAHPPLVPVPAAPRHGSGVVK